MKAEIVVNVQHVLGNVDPNIYGHFLEHFHSCVYSGIFDPQSELSDERGFRSDVIEALKRLRVPLLRWPGGCYADGYHWKKGVGRKDKRPVTFDLAWHQEETNQFGTDEFIDYCRAISAEPCICVNAGSGTAEESAEWVEYCNRRGDSFYTGLRERNGHSEPYGVKYWGVGNELNGNWEIGGPMSGEEYARVFRNFSRLMKRVDPDIKLIAVGSRDDTQFNLDFLKSAGFLADYISIHYYCYKQETLQDYYGAVATPSHAEEKLKNLISTIRTARDISGIEKSPAIAFDEWNSWAWSHYREHGNRMYGPYWGEWIRMEENDINRQYTLRDAIITARFFNLFQRYCSSVKMANYSPTVNGRGAIYVHPAGVVLRPSYHVMDLYMNHGGKESIHTSVRSETYNASVKRRDDPTQIIEITDTPYLDVSATGNRGKLYLSAVNLHKEKAINCRIVILGMEVAQEASIYEINGADVDSFNDEDHPEDVKIATKGLDSCGEEFSYTFPAHSITLMEIVKKR